MPEKFNNKYRIQSTRLQTWDYSWQGAYFITICTKNREHFFGEIKNGIMHLSPVGVIANVLWFEIKNHAKNIELGEFIVMPNHIHGIIILNGNNENVDTVGDNADIGDCANDNDNDNAYDNVKTRHALSLRSQSQSPSNQSPSNQSPSTQSNQPPITPEKTIGQQRCQNQGKNSVSSIVGSYKSAVTKHAHRLHFNFDWQSLFHDHIIRDERSFQNISNYIINNPENWKEDKFFD